MAELSAQSVDEEAGEERRVRKDYWAVAVALSLGCLAGVIALNHRSPGHGTDLLGLRNTPGETTELTEKMPKRLSSHFVTNAPQVKHWKIKHGTRTLKDAFKEAFPDEKSWWKTRFPFSNEPKKTWMWQDVVYWAEDSLLNHSELAFQDGAVPIPRAFHSDDQLDPGHYAGYSRRQVCYLAALALTGGELEGYQNGLTRFLSKEGPGGCLPRRGAFAKALFALLATCGADPTLEGGGPGPLLLAVKHQHIDADMQQLKDLSSQMPLSEGGFRLCRYEEGSVYKQGFLPGLPNSPQEICSQPKNGPGTDYLSTHLIPQAIVEASGPWLGGSFYGGSCDASGGKLEEAMMLFMPEVAVLSLFLSQARDRPQLRAPAWILGARMVLTGLDGTRHWTNSRTNGAIQFKSDLTTIHLRGHDYHISCSRPLLAAVPAFKASFKDLKEARQNRALAQRQAHGPNAFKNQVMAWYQAVSLDAVPLELKNQMPKLVGSLGTGPWMSGFSFGDSQLDVLAIWLGQTLASKSWKPSVFLDFYLYSSFTENPGNQCYLHSKQRCGDCLWTCKSKWFPPGTFYVPSDGFMSADTSKPCVMWSEFACSQHGIEDIFWNFGFERADRLWTMLEKVLDEHKHQNQRSVFDRLFDEVALEAQKKVDPWMPF